MALCLAYRVFKGVNASTFQSTFEKILVECGGEVVWGRCDPGFEEFSTCLKENIQTVALQWEPHYADLYICSRVGSILNCPWIELRIQFEEFWEYNLFVGGTIIDSFCAFPEYYQLGNEDALRGNASLLADNWGVPTARIDKYLVPWVTEMSEYGVFTHTKAYDSDRQGYGDYLQMLDFLHAIGGADVLGIGGGLRVGADHGLRYPPIETLAE